MLMAVAFAVVVVGAGWLTDMGRARSKFATNSIPTNFGTGPNFVGRRAQ